MNMVKIYTGGYIPDLAILDEPEHPMHGWLFYKHPDGQMVSLADSRTFPNGYSAGYAQRYVDMQEAGLQEIMQKAEKWDKMKWHTSCPHEDADCAISPELENVKDDLKTIMAGLMVDEPKKHFYNEDMTECERTEPPATRDATPEEVREFIEFYFSSSPNSVIVLKTGGVLRLSVDV